MEKVNRYILSPEAMIMVAGSSKGAQKKYYENGKWYKENCVGYEGTAEYLASLVVKCSNIEDYVIYEKCLINDKNGCVSENFLNENEAYISLHRLHDIYVGGKIEDYVYLHQDINKRIEYVESFVEDVTGLDIHDYLSKMFTLDALILNTDRHFNNIGIICNSKTNKYKIAPVFDNGRSLLSEVAQFPFDIPIKENIANVVGKPFSSNLEYQAHTFGYGLQLDYEKLYRLLENVEKSRALDVLYLQLEKYRDRLDSKALPQNQYKLQVEKDNEKPRLSEICDLAKNITMNNEPKQSKIINTQKEL